MNEQEQQPIVVNQFSEHTYAVFDDSLIAVVSFTKAANTDMLKRVMEKVLEFHYLRERRDLDEEAWKSGAYDDIIRQNSHPKTYDETGLPQEFLDYVRRKREMKKGQL